MEAIVDISCFAADGEGCSWSELLRRLFFRVSHYNYVCCNNQDGGSWRIGGQGEASGLSHGFGAVLH